MGGQAMAFHDNDFSKINDPIRPEFGPQVNLQLRKTPVSARFAMTGRTRRCAAK